MQPQTALSTPIAQLKAGDIKGFNALYKLTKDFVYRRAKYLMKTEEDALDLMQEVYIQIYKNINSLKNEDSIYAWINKIIYNRAMNMYRRKKKILLDEDIIQTLTPLLPSNPNSNPEIVAETKIVSEVLWGFALELPELQREVVIEHYYKNKKINDIADNLHCSPNTIKSRLRYARKFLREKIEEHEKLNGYKLYIPK